MQLKEAKKYIADNYSGKSKKPEDFDEFWEQELQHLRSIPIKINKTPSEFQFPGSKCFDVSYLSTQNSWIAGKYLIPDQATAENPCPLVVQFHGYKGGSGDWSEKLDIVSMGYAVFAMDTRAQGGWSEDRRITSGSTLSGHKLRGINEGAKNLLFKDVYLDAVRAVDIFSEEPEIDSEQIMVTGASQGGGIALACAALHPKIKKAGVVYPFLIDLDLTWDLKVKNSTIEEISYYFRQFDPQEETSEWLFEQLAYIDIKNFMTWVKADVLWGCALEDEACLPQGQLAAYNQLNASKEIVFYPTFRHEPLPMMRDKILQFFSNK